MGILKGTSKSRMRGVVSALTAAGVMVLGAAGPASAEPAAGVSTGSTNISVSNAVGVPLCAQARSAAITLDNTGTFMAQTAVYEGTSTATYTASTSFWFNPAGTFSDSLCSVPYLVPGSLTVTGSNGTSSVSCSGSAVYTRQAANAYVITTAGMANSCSVTVGATTTPALSAILTFAGNQDPCFDGFPLPLPDPCGVAPELVGVYAQV